LKRAVITCPGRGSYTEKSMGTLPGDHPFVEIAEQLRREAELPSLLELDRAERFSGAVHLRPANVSALIYLICALDCERARREHDVVAIAGNSMGWYSALAMAGALSFAEGFRLVQEMALIQERFEQGGQILYPLVDDEWCSDPERSALVERALAESEGEAFWSIRLGGYAVLAGTEAGVKHLLGALPQAKVGGTLYPFRLMRHGPYHTPLLEPVTAEAHRRLGDLEFRTPEVTLIDGRGRRHTPWSADVDELRRYTFGQQVTTPYDLTASLRVALREYAPDRMVLPGPGNTLGGVVAQVLIAEGWRGLRSKADFQVMQQSEDPPIESMRRA
jgi:[acyl-carrier-protein] S-malonyltransferase